MQQKFKDYIKEHNLCPDHEKVLLSVSGGIDSMVMAHLFINARINAGIVHCNFKLRGIESDHDEAFVRQFALKHNIPFFSKSFNTQPYAARRKISIQMAARELRIRWTEQIINENHYNSYATAHHLDDQIETFFNNLLRGAGIRGLHGILPRQGNLIHPMLFCYRHEIEQYASHHHIAFRVDSSNSKTDYQRNKIRHVIIPGFETIKPDFKLIMTRNIEHLKAAENIYELYLNQLRHKLVSQEEGITTIEKQALLELDQKESVLFELLKPFDFNFAQVKAMLENAMDGQGSVFYSDSSRLVIDRVHFIIEKRSGKPTESFIINAGEKELKRPIRMAIVHHQNTASLTFSASPETAMLDAQKLVFPLLLRKWQKGDYFYPLGMKNKKLLSDFFIDNKFSIPEKENTWIMLSEQKIVWIVGYRIDDRYKITSDTTRVFEFQLKGNA